MTDADKPFTIAAVQAAPVFMDRDATIDKACGLIADAAKRGAKIIVFPEAFVPTYPDWVWVLPPSRAGVHRQLYAELLDQSVAIPSDPTDKIGRAAKAAGVYVVIGVNERNVEASGASLYNTIIYFGPDGAILGKHRKLMPTSAERLVWAAGDGSTLDTYDTPYGRLGGLICWENYMPSPATPCTPGAHKSTSPPPGTRPIAGWPAFATSPRRAASTLSAAASPCAGRHPRPLRVQGPVPARGRPLGQRRQFRDRGPDGDFIAGPIAEKEDILYAEIDPSEFRAPRYWFDPPALRPARRLPALRKPRPQPHDHHQRKRNNIQPWRPGPDTRPSDHTKEVVKWQSTLHSGECS
jgi:nitrilase